MKSIFCKKKNIIEKNPLLIEAEKTNCELLNAYKNFENVIDPDLIDSCIYEMNSLQLKYKFLLRKLKETDN